MPFGFSLAIARRMASLSAYLTACPQPVKGHNAMMTFGFAEALAALKATRTPIRSEIPGGVWSGPQARQHP